ncbi:protein JTB [Amia ocellicauda]|uniref:protein JTB n=1 Tax=Amia ocellicauda TaxID=2972642 RepID=UPI00346397E6
MYPSSLYAWHCVWMSWSFLLYSIRSCEGAPLKQKDLFKATQPPPCWVTEEFTVQQDCSPCSEYQKKTEAQCVSSGLIEQLKCNKSGHVEYRSCRSAAAEELKFWKFEGAMLAFSTVFAILVMLRQRKLDRRAEYKVRQQIQGI